MPERVQMRVGRYLRQHVRYWGWFALKVLVGELLVACMLWVVNLGWRPDTRFAHVNLWQFGYDLTYTSMVGICFLCGYLVLSFAIRDQAYRCRVCLRRMVMPVERGSWSRMLQFGRPKMEYICPYGHGTLGIHQIQFPGKEMPEWKEHAGIWEELCGAHTEE